jgi:hypothetical protein
MVEILPGQGYAETLKFLNHLQALRLSLGQRVDPVDIIEIDDAHDLHVDHGHYFLIDLKDPAILALDLLHLPSRTLMRMQM